MEILISGASTGIGRMTAVHLARKGHSVWAGVRSEQSFNETVALNVKDLKPIYLDVCDDKSVELCVSRIKKEAGILHGLVNNAGIVIGGPMEAVSMADWKLQFEVNLFGVVRTTKACLPLLRECKGRIVNISSLAGRVAGPVMGPYSASKFALEAMSDCLRRELKPQGIDVVVIEPGPIDTPLWNKSLDKNLRSVDSYPEELRVLYSSLIKRFQKNFAEAPNRSSPPSVVVHAIEDALTAMWPNARYPVGRGIKLATWISNAVPDRLMDKIVSRI